MNYQEYTPSPALRDYVKCYYLYESDTSLVNDKALATGCLEVMFNLSGYQWESLQMGSYVKTARVEIWGQVVRPVSLQLSGRSCMMGIRFHPYGAAAFLREDISVLNDQIIDLTSVLGKPVEGFYDQLIETPSIASRIALIDKFLINRLSHFDGKMDKITLIKRVINEITCDDFSDNMENVAMRYGITARYLQKIFLQHTGLTPKLYSKINRFQKSLVLISRRNLPLTTIALDSGYFDQSHFIREFKAFSGMTPSSFDADKTSAVLASPNKPDAA